MSYRSHFLFHNFKSMNLSTVLQQLHSLADPDFATGMGRYGIANSEALGIRIPVLRSYARSMGRNHALALELWRQPLHEAKLLAIFLAEWKKVTEAMAEEWIGDFYSWDLVDQAVDLFYRQPWALDKAAELCEREAEFEKRTGIVLLIALVIKQKKWPDERFLPFFEKVEQVACDDRNFVKKAANWLLRQLGKRSLYLHPHAIACGERLQGFDCKAAHWIAADALRELRNEKIMDRLRKKASKN